MRSNGSERFVSPSSRAACVRDGPGGLQQTAGRDPKNFSANDSRPRVYDSQRSPSIHQRWLNDPGRCVNDSAVRSTIAPRFDKCANDSVGAVNGRPRFEASGNDRRFRINARSTGFNGGKAYPLPRARTRKRVPIASRTVLCRPRMALQSAVGRCPAHDVRRDVRSGSNHTCEPGGRKCRA